MNGKGRMLTTMTEILHRAGRVMSLLVLVSVLAVAVSGPATAARTTSKEVVDAYTRAQELMEQDKTREALAVIRQVLRGERTPDEKAVLLRFAAQLEVELGNFRNAIRDIEASMTTGVLTDVEIAENYFFLGRLYLGVEPPNYPKAIENLRKFISVADNPDPNAYFYLGQALAMTGKYREAIPNANKAIELSKTPQENHYRLLLFCYSELQDYRSVVSTVERMLTFFPVKDEYLSQLAAGYSELGRDKDAFLVQAFRYELGFLDSESELVGMADLYLTFENPHRAARILDKEMRAGRVKRTRKNLEKLGNMWFLAREYKEARTNLTAAAKLSPKGELDFRIAQTYFEDENWKMAETHFRRALNKGGLREPCQARVLLGHTLNNQEKVDAAIEQFRRAAKAKACAKEANQWVQYLETQKTINRRTQTYQIMTQVLNLKQKVGIAASEDEGVRAIAEEAKEAAQAAVDAESGQVRQRNLSEYERARDSALRRLNAGAMDEAKKDKAEVDKVAGEARATKLLNEDELKVVEDLEKQANGRVKALEEARTSLEEAAKLAEQARSK